jgi:hypothetical protein
MTLPYLPNGINISQGRIQQQAVLDAQYITWIMAIANAPVSVDLFGHPIDPAQPYDGDIADGTVVTPQGARRRSSLRSFHFLQAAVDREQV